MLINKKLKRHKYKSLILRNPIFKNLTLIKIMLMKTIINSIQKSQTLNNRIYLKKKYNNQNYQ
jgi:hypothetical protein